MKALICAINSKYVHSSLSVWCLAGGIEAYASEEEYNVVEATINESFEAILSKITKHEFEVIGFSTYIWNKEIVLSLAKALKDKNNVKIVLGGPEVSYNAEEMLSKYPFIDYIISGEGELPFAQLVKEISPCDIDGVSYRKDGELIVKEPYISDCDPPSPYTNRYFENLNGRIAYLETSRGCPYSCAFCLSGRCGGVRFFDLEETKKRILLLANSGTKTIKFVDRTFNANKKRAVEIIKFIIDNYNKKIPPSVRFHFEIEGEIINEELIKILALAPKGLFQIEIGLQSFNEATLEYINRKTNIDRLTSNIKKILSLGNVHTHLDLIAGLSLENYDSFAKSFNKAYSLKPHALQLGFLKLLHGAEMRENKEKYKCEFIDTPPYEIVSNQWISKEELEKLHLVEDVFEKMYNSKRFALTCDYLSSIFTDHFEMFEKFAIYINEIGIENTLDSFSYAMLSYFSKFESVDTKVLRDKMAIDRLATNKMGSLPEFLKIKCPMMKQYLNLLEKSDNTKSKKGIKRAATILSSESLLAYVDYDTLDPITNRFNVCFVHI